MCGIAGFVGKGPAEEQVARASHRMVHRGPDDSGLLRKGNAVLGFRRLAIIDLTPAGHQPMESADGRIALVFNGEIYNFQKLRAELVRKYQFASHSDTEVILHGYREWGWDELLRRIDGMFAIALWDNDLQKLHCARDRAGKKPFFYSETAHGFAFASTLNSLLELLPGTPAVDELAIDDFLTYQSIGAGRSIYRGVKQLEPAHQLTYENRRGALSLGRYWSLNYGPKHRLSEQEVLDQAEALLSDAVKARMVSDVPVGAFLSGGVDSSVVVAMMAKHSSKPVEAVVIGFDDQLHDERAHARKVASHLNVRLHETVLNANAVEVLPEMIWQFGQPLADPSIIPTYYVAKAARQHVTVVLNGDGGDEVFGGYSRPMIAHASRHYRNFVPSALRRLAANTIPLAETRGAARKLGLLLQSGQFNDSRMVAYDRGLYSLRSEMYSAEMLSSLSQYDPQSLYENVWTSALAETDVDRVLDVDFRRYLPDQLLAKMDVSTMAHSLEARSPLLSTSLIEFAARIPSSLKLKNLETKYLLKKIAARHVPAEVVYRNKRGFVPPLNKWLGTILNGQGQRLLTSKTFADRNWVRPQFVNRILAEHGSGQRNWGQQIWTLLVLEIWARIYLDRSVDRVQPLEAVA